MRKKMLLQFVLAMLAILIGCGSGASGIGAYVMGKLPSKFTADIPKSIIGNADDYSKSAVQKSIGSKSNPGDESQGCRTMKDLTLMMLNSSTMSPVFAVLADAAITQNSLTADETEHECNLTITSGMIKTMSEIMGDSMEDAGSGMEEMEGYPIPVKIKYSDAASDPYKYSAEITIDGETAAIYWDEDKKKTKLDMEVTFETWNSAGGSSSEKGTVVFMYDDTENSMHLTMSSPSNYLDMSIKKQGEGALFYSRCKYNDSNELIEGYADDDGGYVKTTLTGTGFSAIIEEDTFNAEGIVIAESSYENEYVSGSEEIIELQGDTGITKNASGVADGIYVLLTSGTTGSGELVGFGIVSSGNIIIQDIGGDQYGVVSDSGSTDVYLYSIGTDGSIASSSSTKIVL